MKTIKLLISLASLSALTAAAQMGGGGGGTNGMGTNQYSYTNHWEGGGDMWWTNATCLTNGPRPMNYTNRHEVVPPNHAGQLGPRPGGQMNMPADMQALMQQFQTDRQTYMTRQRALETQMKDASEQERQAVMAQMQQQMQQWKDQQAQMRQTMQQQMQEMMQRMQDQTRLMQQATQPGPGQQGGRPRH